MAVNQLMGTGYGVWKDGFDKVKFFNGLHKIVLLAVGYGTVAMAAHFAGNYIGDAEYISGLLIDPIVRYFAKLIGNLKVLVSDSKEA